MKIYIIGAGAIGKTLAVCLSLNGSDVQVIRGSVDEGSEYVEKFTLYLKSGEVLTSDIKINYLNSCSTFDGLIILANKSFGNRELAKKLKDKAKNTPLVILQNGLNIEQSFLNRDFQEIYRCVLFATCQNITPNEISYKPVAPSPIGIIKQHSSLLKPIVDILNTPNFGFVSEDNIEKIIWKKAIANCVFNSICPLLEVDNGIFYRDAHAFEIAKSIIRECTLIANNNGIGLTVKEVEEQVISISKMSEGQFISTLQDIRNNRKTEIESLNLEVYRMAKQMNLESKVQQTKLLGDLVMIKSELNQ
ncbi:ketopantoate reductase family protein [Echinicola sp. 20G]|uniref:ketopantoate reductase family protein n=1 Tax=Echinicola sp. 20G TaxID=2781961 RepID=UPI0019111360|nr:2-dehydropantoate 2-reductase [Echinicola sp. 20G]